MDDFSPVEVISDTSGPLIELGNKAVDLLAEVVKENPKASLIVGGGVAFSYFAFKYCSEISFKDFKYKAKP
jgi:hypothetical protein|tara:strand:- start:469 stop:681 length:213 start_codon:yes stop_codon:yes gene_type:complete